MHVSDTDLELFFLGRLPPDQLSVAESHLTDCSSCGNRLSDVLGLFLNRLSSHSRCPGNYDGTEKRREHRIPTDLSGQMQSFSPFSPTKIRVQMTDVSRNGLKIHTTQFVGRGAIVRVLIKEAIILGEVRYCIPAGTEFDAGIQILDLIPRARA
jgi:PilZ domain